MPEQSKNFLESLGQVLSTGSRASSSLAAGLMGQDPAQWWSSGKTYHDLVKEQFPDMNPVLQEVVGLAADVFLDPTTYLGIGAATKVGEAGKVVRPLLSFAGHELVKGEPVMNAARDIGKAALGTDTGTWLMSKFGSGEMLRKIKYPELQTEFQGYKSKLGEGLGKAQMLKSDLMRKYAAAGVDKESELQLLQVIETLPRDTRAQFHAAEEAAKRAIGPEGADIFQIASFQHEDAIRRLTELGYPMAEVEAGFAEKHGLQYLPHYRLKPYNRNEIKQITEQGGVNPNLATPSILLGRSRKGTLKEFNEALGRGVYEDYLPEILGRRASELAHAEAGLDYARAMAKHVGVAKGAAPVGYVAPKLGRDPYNVFDKIFRTPEGEQIWIPKELQNEVARVAKGVISMDNISGSLLGMYDAGTNWWRRMTLYPFPGFYFRNFISNIWNNHLAGINGYKDYIDAASFMKRIRFGQLIEGDEKLLSDMLAHQVIGGGRIAQEYGRIAPDMKQAWIEGNWYPLSKNFKALNVGAWANQAIENNARVAHYLHFINQGFDPQQAAASVMKFLPGGTANLSKFEMNVMRRIIPFYTWTRGNLPLQLEMMIEKPGKFANLTKFIDSVGNLFGPPPVEKWMGDYMKENAAAQMWRSENGQQQYFLLRNWIPTYDLLALEDPLNDVFSMINPLPKEFLQQYFNYDTFFKRPISRDPKDLNPLGGELGNFVGQTLNTRIIHLMRNVRLLGELDRINPFGVFGTDRPHHAKDSAEWEKALMAIGLKLTPYDPEKAKDQWMRDFGDKIQTIKGQITYAKKRGYVEEAARYQLKLEKQRQKYQEFIAQ